MTPSPALPLKGGGRNSPLSSGERVRERGKQATSESTVNKRIEGRPMRLP